MIEKPEELFVGYVAQKAIIESDGKILFVKGNSADAKWDLPGGRLHKDEAPVVGLERELEEEIGVRCSIGQLVTALAGVRLNEIPVYFVFFVVAVQDDVRKIELPADELSAYTWLAIDEIVSGPVYDNCVSAVETYLCKKYI